MSRYLDTLTHPSAGEPPPLPVVDYRRVDCRGPRPLTIADPAPADHLPEADDVVVTWTEAEWSALDQVFAGYQYPRPPAAREWQRDWHLFSRDNHPTTGSDQRTGPLWGWYRLVDVFGPGGGSRRVLLLKSDSHLAHPPWFAGLTQLVTSVLKDTRAATIYSVGTAGAGHPDQQLGEVVVTNAGHLELKDEHNADTGIDGQTFTCPGAFPALTMLDPAATHLMSPLSGVATFPRLEALLATLHRDVPQAQGITLPDLVTDATDPRQLHHPRTSPVPGKPLLTTDYYYIDDGTGPGRWAVLEMDDTVVGYVAGGIGVDYVFVRNVSDPVVPATTRAGVAIPDEVRSHWSSLIYTAFGLYTSFNGAVTSWATIAAGADR
jgi:hypothetical protein